MLRVGMHFTMRTIYMAIQAPLQPYITLQPFVSMNGENNAHCAKHMKWEPTTYIAGHIITRVNDRNTTPHSRCSQGLPSLRLGGWPEGPFLVLPLRACGNHVQHGDDGHQSRHTLRLERRRRRRNSLDEVSKRITTNTGSGLLHFFLLPAGRGLGPRVEEGAGGRGVADV
jgi:hypothetical protein